MYKCKKTSSKRKNAKFIIRAINNTQFDHGGWIILPSEQNKRK